MESQYVSNEVMFQVWLHPGAQTQVKSSGVLFSLFPVPPSHSFPAFYWLHSGGCTFLVGHWYFSQAHGPWTAASIHTEEATSLLVALAEML